MRLPIRFLAATSAGFAVGVAVMAHDRAIDRQWAVTRAQISDAQASGQRGVALKDGRMAIEPIPSEDADLLPLKWMAIGLCAGGIVFSGTRRRRPR